MGHGIQFRTIILISGKDPVTILTKLETRRTGFSPDFHRFRFGHNRTNSVIRDESGKNIPGQDLFRFTFRTVYTPIHLLTQFDPPIEHPVFVRDCRQILVPLVFTVTATDDNLCILVVIRGNIYTFQTLSPKIHFVAGFTIYDDRWESRFTVSILG